VRVPALEHQEGEAEVVFAGQLFGTTVATSHTVREGGRLRQYVVLFGHLERAIATPGAKPARGETLGLVGDTGSPGLVHLHLEVRQVREQIELGEVASDGRRLVDPAVTVATDPRNVLVLR
jgi:murein DD-endopeptidase MepM/ murein hydrolase activator NlpD